VKIAITIVRMTSTTLSRLDDSLKRSSARRVCSSNVAVAGARVNPLDAVKARSST